MNPHLRKSRVSKALTDAGLSSSFGEAEARLAAVTVCVHVSKEQSVTAAGQAAALTAVLTAYKCFGRVSVVLDSDADLLRPLPIGKTLSAALLRLGADIRDAPSSEVTHHVHVGISAQRDVWSVECWWDRWLAGVRADEEEPLGDSRLALAGIFAAAIAIRQVFRSVRQAGARPTDATVSLWEPWTQDRSAGLGPTTFTCPDALWLLGLGHLGQAYVWSLIFLPYSAPRRAILQDDQKIGEENEPTSLLVEAGDVGEKKVRVAARWLEACGWTTQIIERRHAGDIALTPDDPPILICGLDDVVPRKKMVAVGFDYMIDGGIGNGPTDFEGIQIRAIAKGSQANSWNDSAAPKSPTRTLLKAAYQALEQEIGGCGMYSLANASVAVPFVGAATGALAIAQAIRLSSMKSSRTLLQLELATPEMIIDSDEALAPPTFLGGELLELI